MNAEEHSATTRRKHWRSVLHHVGLKCTEQRLAVLHELEIAVAPMSHRDIMDRIGSSHWDPTTTFRNLVDLYEAGLVNRFDVGDHTWRYKLRKEQADHSAQHPHFLCLGCGCITCLPSVSIGDATRWLQLPTGLQFIEEVLVKGRCGECQTKVK